MAALSRGLPPCNLTYVSPGNYRDEKQRLWMVVSHEFTPDNTHNWPGDSLIIRMQQVSKVSQEAPSSVSPCLAYIPTKWVQYSLILYLGSDNRFWKLMDHIQIGGREQLDLKLDFSEGL
ncbi:protein TCL1B5-like [Mesocricetus auratus]|uniref:Protein TCL1B5-like n=1 Tax=Mesocricetus auratus TaxID=10036 RepID=A0ABM2X6I8_MESAU|nr:protein TCL1B5-like [Mesocricetus auratus]